MTTDLSALRAKLNKLNRGKGSTSNDSSIWKPSEGKHTIRIVPWKENPKNPFIELYFHYIANRTYYSPLNNGNRDPIKEFADDIRSEGTKEAYSMAREFEPKLRTYVPIIVRGEEDKGVRFWSFGVTVYKQLIEFMTDKDIGDLADPEEGRDLVLTYVSKENSDTNFAKSTVMYKPKQTPLSENSDQIKSWLTEQPDIKELYDEPSFNDLKNVLAKRLDPDGDYALSAKSQPEESPSTTVATKAPEAAKTSVADALDEFDKLFDS